MGAARCAAGRRLIDDLAGVGIAEGLIVGLLRQRVFERRQLGTPRDR
jgi:hypothetical protein